MSNLKKAILIVIAILIVVLIGVGAYLWFGVVGIDEKRIYSESKIVDENVNTGKTVLDETATYQVMNGFGASACWWSQDVGSWENRDDIMALLYDKEKGIGLNIYRYNLGAGSKGDSHILTENRATECFMKDSSGTYDFESTDISAKECLNLAKKHAGDDLRVTLFCNSPPVFLTKNGAGYGAPLKEDEEWVTNLDPSNYQAFADYCYTCTEHFINEGYRVTDISPVNEPQYSWAAWYNDDATYSVNQEGCHYSKTETRDLLKVMVNRFSETDVEKNGCRVSMFESGSAEGKDSSCAAYYDCILGKGPKYVFKNKILRDYFDSVSVHSYWSSTEDKEKAAQYLSSKYSTYDVAATEYCQMTNDENTGVFDLISAEKDGTNGMTIDYGVAMAKVIVDDLTILNAKEWDWWTACSYGVYPDGLIYLNPDNHDDIQLSKRFWCLGNFSRFIDEGATRIAGSSGVDGVSSCAFVNPNNKTVVVYVNNTTEDKNTQITTTGDYEVYTTSDKYDLEKTADGTAGDVNVELPSMSVVTVIYK